MKYWKLMLAIGTFALVSMAVLYLSAGDKKEYLLSGKIEKGKTQTITYTRELTLDARIPAMPKHPSIAVYENISQKISQEIQEVKNNYITKLKRKYEESLLKTELKKKPKADILDKKVVKILIKEDTKKGTSELKVEVSDAKISDDLKNNFSPDENNFILFLPPDKVKIDDEWTITSPTLRAVFNFATTRRRIMHHGSFDLGLKPVFDDGAMTCKLKEVKKIKNEETAIIEMTGKLSAEENELNETLALSGTAYFLINKGNFTKLEFEGEITLAGDQPCSLKQPPRHVEGEGELKLTIEFK